MKTSFSYFQQFSLPKVRKTHLKADYVTNNQILVIKIIKIRPPTYYEPPLIRFYEFFQPPGLLRPPTYSGPKSMKEKILILFDDQLNSLIGTVHLQTVM